MGYMKMNKPTVDVLILTFGNYSGLERTIDSVLAQRYPIRTIVLSDDGSGQPFPSRLIRRLEESPARVIVRNGENNLGTVAHMNVAARLTDGDYLKGISPGDAFSDCDALGALIAFAGQADAPAVTSNCIVCSSDLERKYYRFPGAHRGKQLRASGWELFSVLAQKNVVSAAGTLLRRDFFQELGGFDESYRLLEDWPAWLRLAREGYGIPYLPRVTALYGAGGVSSSNGDAFCAPRLQEDMLHCFEKEILPYMDRLAPKARRIISYSYERLKGVPSKILLKKYFLLEAKEMVKRGIKTCMMRNRG